jgi:hypothetical protein
MVDRVQPHSVVDNSISLCGLISRPVFSTFDCRNPSVASSSPLSACLCFHLHDAASFSFMVHFLHFPPHVTCGTGGKG